MNTNTNTLPAEIVPSYPSPEYYRWYFCGSLASAQLHLDMARTLGKSEETIARRMDTVEQIRHDMKCQSIECTEKDLQLARVHAAQKGLAICSNHLEECEDKVSRERTSETLTFYLSIVSAALLSGNF